MRAVMTAGSLQGGSQFGQADRAVAIAVELAEHIVGLREVGAACAECVFKFRFGNLAIAIAVDLREQVLQAAAWMPVWRSDWLCAASSSLIVAGEICAPAPNPVAGTGLAEAGAGLATSNGFAEPWSKPVDDAEDVSD